MESRVYERERESVEDDGQSGGPKDATTYENVKFVHTLVMCDKEGDVPSIASEVGISFAAVQSIITNKVCQRFPQDGCREC